MMMAVPLVTFYEIGIIAARLVGKPKVEIDDENTGLEQT